MATTTPNFGWDIPQSTDLVKDGATAIAALGNDIDTSMVDLKGGTTGQVLSKASNTDMDFTWVAQDDSNAIQNTIVDAKGDIITATAADTPARLAVGSNGYTLVADSSTSTGLAYVPTFFAGKNKIINGDFGIWQRGTSFSGTNQLIYTADRWQLNDFGGQTSNVARSTFTAGTAPVSGYEGQYFATWSRGGGGTASSYLTQKIEDVRTFAGQTVTFSFWAKAAATETLDFYIDQNFGSGGSATVGSSSTSFTLTTSWTRYSFTVTLASISGKTVGTSSFLAPTFQVQTSQGAFTIDLWGVQLEAGSTVTQFQTATGTIQEELAACQRYYEKTYAQGTAPATSTQSNMVGNPSGGINSTATGYFGYYIPFKVTKRSSPTITLYDAAGTSGKVSKYESVNLTKTDGITGNADAIGDSSIRVTITSVSGYSGFAFHYVADSEL